MKMTGAQLQAYIDSSTFNYGDVLNYYAPASGQNNTRRLMHAQIYTGNLYEGKPDSYGDVGVGWTTDNKSNYGAKSVYRSGGGHPWTIYWFRIKDEYKGSATSATVQQSGTDKKDKESLEKSASAFNSLTYRLAIIYKLKDNYGPAGDPLFERFKGTFSDEKNNSALLNWSQSSLKGYPEILINILIDMDSQYNFL
jgi:hypothetical protein